MSAIDILDNLTAEQRPAIAGLIKNVVSYKNQEMDELKTNL